MAAVYLLAVPGGDVRLGEGDLDRPFMVAPAESHPFLTLGDYFRAVELFLRRSGRGPAAGDPEDHAPGAVWFIRSEKHGALYHIASAAMAGTRLAVTTAVSDPARAMLSREFGVLRSLAAYCGPGLLPEVFDLRTIDLPGRGPAMTMMLGEWLDDYHEWHLSRELVGGAGVAIWDSRRGHGRLAEKEERELIRQASRLLTLGYDPATFRQIHPWHHAAGDFVIRRGRGDTEPTVRLITARNHVPFLPFEPEGEAAPLMGLLWFFMHLALRMRLDRLDGTGDLAWLPDHLVLPMVAGFFAGLAEMPADRRAPLGPAAAILDLLQSFNFEELRQLHRPLLDLYDTAYPPEEVALIATRLEGHVEQLLAALRSQRV